MKGTYEIFWTDQPSESHICNRPPKLAIVESLLRSSPDPIPYWDQWLTWRGVLVPALVVGNDAWRDQRGPLNLLATALWHYVARSKGITLASTITGPVIVFTGDEEFFAELLTV